MSGLNSSAYNETSTILQESTPPDVFSLTTKICLTFPYIPLTIVALCGNALVCFVINHYLNPSVTNIFLFNLSITDILTTLAVVPMTTIADIWLSYWPFGATMCKLIPFVQCLTTTLTAFTHVLISCDRFAIIFRPLQRRRLLTTRRAKIVVSIIWLFACIQALPLAIVGTLQKFPNTRCVESWDAHQSQVYGMTLLVLQYFLPLTLLICSYTTITFRLKAKHTETGNSSQRCEAAVQSKRKMVKMMIALSTLYGISQLPRHVLFLYGTIVNWGTSDLAIVWNVTVLLSTSACCYNPFVYAWMNQKYRSGFYQVFVSMCHCFSRSYKGSSTTQLKSRRHTNIINDEI